MPSTSCFGVFEKAFTVRAVRLTPNWPLPTTLCWLSVLTPAAASRCWHGDYLILGGTSVWLSAALAGSIAVSPSLDITYIWRPDARTQDILGCVQADLSFVTIMTFYLNECVVDQQSL